GCYVFFMGIVNSVQSGLELMVISRYYPSLVKYITTNNYNYIFYKKKMKKLILSLGSGLYVFSVLLAYIVVIYLNNDYFIEYFYIYPLLCTACFIGNISLVDHYILYGLNEDKYILICNF